MLYGVPRIVDVDCRVACAPRNDVWGMECRVLLAMTYSFVITRRTFKSDVVIHSSMDCRVAYASRNDVFFRHHEEDF